MKGKLTMKLCKELQQIYKSELARGNCIVWVTNHKKTEDAPGTMFVQFKKPLARYDGVTVQRKEYYGTFVPSEIYYFCPDCGMAVSGPMHASQYMGWPKGKEIIPHPSVIATPENVYWLDESWYYDGAVPTLMDSFDDQDKSEVEKC